MSEIQTSQVSSGSLPLSLPTRTVLALVGILAVAAFLRLYDLNWDSNHHLHPDERHIVMVTMDRISLPFPNLGDAHLTDARRSTLNPRSADPGSGQPRSFAYGSLPLYLLKLTGHVASPWWKATSGIDGLTLLGRLLSVLFDLGTVLLAFLIGRRLYSARAGLLAALLLSVTVLHIQLSHFYASDTLLTFFLVATLYLGLRVLELPSTGRVTWMGAAAGLALSCKVSAAPILLACAVACSLSDRRRGVGAMPAILLAGAVAGGVFLLFQPYALLDLQPFLRDIQYESEMVRGIQIPPYTIQYVRTEPVLYQLRNLFLWTAGPALGGAILVGLLVLAVRLLWRQRPAEWMLVAWLVPYLAVTLSFQVKFVRYLLPVMPLLVIMAAAWIAALATPARLGSRRSWIALGALVVVVAGAALQAAAFISIYDADHTRVRASRWIYDNVPRGAALATEHWDDSLPLPLAGAPGRPGDYVNITMPMYDPENEGKRQEVLRRLAQANYIILASNRLYASIPRVPETYPMATAYYSMLFDGKLGFDLVASFTSYPSLGPIELNDDTADESFTVYDHPKVLVFKKGPGYSPERVAQLLADVPLDGVVPVKQALSGGGGLLLSEETRAMQEQGGTWSALYNPEGISNRFPVLAWWLAVLLLGLLALPLAWRVFARYPDRGYGLAKVLGILIVTYVAWLLPSLRLVPFGRLSILAGLAVLGLLSWLILHRNWASFVEFLSAHRRVFLVHELVFLAAFALFLLIRARNPDLWHLAFGGEKPMEFAFLNAVAKSTYFPPYDPWHAGGYINYYYFGYVIVATVMRLTGVVPAVAFNLAIASVFALTAAGLFSFGFNYLASGQRLAGQAIPRSALLGGIATVTLVLLVGNLDGLVQYLEALWKLGTLQVKSTLPMLEGTVKALAGLWAVFVGGKSLPPFDFWRSTRVIGPENPTPISEFPYFTFLYGDLHPHMIAMPLATLALGLALAIVWQGRGDGETRLPSILVGGLVVGALQATNSWDYPTYMLLLAVGFLLAAHVREGALTGRGILRALLYAAATYAAGIVLFQPFTRAYELFYNGVDPSPAKTSVPQYLVIFGFFLFAIGSTLVVDLLHSRSHRFWLRYFWERALRSPRSARRGYLVSRLVRPSPLAEALPYLLAALLAAALAAALVKLHLIALLMLFGGLILLSLFIKDAPPEKLLVLLFAGTGVALTLGVEFVTIKGDVGRMNTVFKFYLQAWFLLGIASALGITGILARWRASSPPRPSPWRTAWAAAMVMLLLSVLIYPVAATPVKLDMRFQPTPPTLDGMAYMNGAVFRDQNNEIHLARDYRAIKWLQSHVAGSPTVLEAQIPEYRWGSRVSIYTGLPTVLGWTWHERQQRWGYQSTIDQRLRDIKAMFESTDTALVSRLLDKYQVRLIYVGDLERAYYPAAGLAKFETMVGDGLSVAYRADGVTIYEVRGGGQPSVVLSLVGNGS